MVERTIYNDISVLTLRPNRSANWQQTKYLIGIIAVFVSFIALIWAALGIWIILPFAGLEVSLLAFLLYRGSRSTYRKQVITIDHRTIKFEAGITYPACFYLFALEDSSLHVTEATLPFDFCELYIRDKNHSVSLGQFLNQDDRLLAISYLQQAGVYIQNERWWLQRK
ncbi:MAG: DUF2244 domain-containing protein [Paraglaciecola sp.]|uniref:DUF2244 domain-containing protein n=1 Tax=Pseudomonadati TaxID=3379134 RepID=UPI00273F422E|nr:DUF2244 domain-containing protein [Paraglaciecola sp.]MDP5032133.1 DUF2244 domain-containing protein [Paraglaciecola sp.]MDP5132565.1 DUF2244 domain-containing protein [Paraglaciecola sp.]